MLLILATLAAGLFAGATIYITAVEHPARLVCGPELAVRESRQLSPGHIDAGAAGARRCAAGIVAGWQRSDLVLVLAATVLGAVVPFTSRSCYRPTSAS